MNLFADLASLAGPTQVDVTISATNAVGTTGRGSFSFTFNVIGPPVALVEDGGYGANAPKSTFGYTIGNGLYAQLYDDATAHIFAPEYAVRFLHYFVSNPTDQPIALVPPAPRSWTVLQSF